jgi:hypothetical protein
VERIECQPEVWDAIIRRLIRAGSNSSDVSIMMMKLADNRQFIGSIVKQLQFLGTGLPTFKATFAVFEKLIREPQNAMKVLSGGFVSSLFMGYCVEDHNAILQIVNFFRDQINLPEIFMVKFLGKVLECQEDGLQRKGILMIAFCTQIKFLPSYVQIPPILSSVINSPKLRRPCFRILAALSRYDECKSVIANMNLDLPAARVDQDEQFLRWLLLLERHLSSFRSDVA